MFGRMLQGMQFINVFYMPWALALQNLDVEQVQISFCEQVQWEMISQMVRSERTNLYVDPRLARTPQTTCAG
ncbi:hypothetical protein N9L68_05800 [bacterium]|nr:hypothetical protein [bacterium]